MRVFVTGASGWIGSHVVPELIDAGHEVVGLARSEESAARIEQAGGTPHRGSLDDLDSLRAGAEATDGVIHLAFIHDFSRMSDAAAADRAAIDTFGDALEGTGKPLVIASGTLGLKVGEVSDETYRPESGGHPRMANATATLALADRGVRSAVVRLAPTVHGAGDQGFMPFIIGKARETGVAGYVGDGENRWSAVHVTDAARLFRLAVESAPARSVFHASSEDVRLRDVADLIARELDIPTASVEPEHFDWMAFFIGMDSPVSTQITRDVLGWEPTGPALLPDLEAHYFG